MKKQIRRGVFETNSSSVHSLTMCMKSDFDKWVDGEVYWDRWSTKFVSKEVAEQSNYKDQYYSYERYINEIEYETFYDEFTSPNNDVIVSFGYYGNDH